MPRTNTAQNNELLALYTRLKGAPERERRAIERKLDVLLECGTPSTDALEHLPIRLDVPKENGAGKNAQTADLIPGAALEAALEKGHTALEQGYAAPQVVPEEGPR
jgi:hypothetical protein